MILHAGGTAILLVIATHLSNLEQVNELCIFGSRNFSGQTHSASIACLARSRGRVNLLLDILGVIGRRVVLLGLDELDVIERGRIIVRLSLHDCRWL